jgi:uncharacterized membrane protein YhaH (DUF805 family)
MTSSIPFGRRGVRAPAAWPSAAPAAREEFAERPPRQAWSPPPVAKREKTARSDDGSPSGPIWLLFGFNGRVRRAQYWLVWIVIEAIMLVLTPFNSANLVSVLQGHMDPLRSELLGAASFLVLWINLAIKAKRWHDRDKSWFWALLLFVPLVGGLWALIECGFLEGTPGPNRFGPSPKGIGDPSVDLSDFD